MPAKSVAQTRELDALASTACHVRQVVHPPMGGVRPIGAGGSWVSLRLPVRT